MIQNMSRYKKIDLLTLFDVQALKQPQNGPEGLMKLSKCDCRFQGLAEQSLFMKFDKPVMAFVMKSSLANQISVRKQSFTLLDPIVSCISRKTSLTFRCIIISGWTLHVSARGGSTSYSLQTLSITSRLWAVLSVITKSMFERMSCSVYLKSVAAPVAEFAASGG